MNKPTNYIAFELPYNGVLVLPASMAETIANHAVVVEKHYADGKYTYSLHDRSELQFTVLRAETITAAMVAKRVAS